jgi:hypothetical protein
VRLFTWLVDHNPRNHNRRKSGRRLPGCGPAMGRGGKMPGMGFESGAMTLTRIRPRETFGISGQFCSGPAVSRQRPTAQSPQFCGLSGLSLRCFGNTQSRWWWKQSRANRSPRQIPCYAGKIQGIFAIQANFRPSRAGYPTEKRPFFSQIPYSAEQGIILTLSGNNREISGNR